MAAAGRGGRAEARAFVEGSYGLPSRLDVSCLKPATRFRKEMGERGRVAWPSLRLYLFVPIDVCVLCRGGERCGGDVPGSGISEWGGYLVSSSPLGRDNNAGAIRAAMRVCQRDPPPLVVVTPLSPHCRASRVGRRGGRTGL